ncbi:hypothetical protein, partial [Vibrio anguillarum]|uniref:hypothetical protein n=1 Tax=Vibrio anguillarum TaxID=55601 RepID=UPI001C0588CB
FTPVTRSLYSGDCGLHVSKTASISLRVLKLTQILLFTPASHPKAHIFTLLLLFTPVFSVMNHIKLLFTPALSE